MSVFEQVAWTLPSSASGQTDSPAPLAAVLFAIVTAFYLCSAVQLSLHTGTRKGILTSKKVSHFFTGNFHFLKNPKCEVFFILLFCLEQKWRLTFFSCCVKSGDMRAERVTVYELLFSLQSLPDIIWLLCQNDKETQTHLIKMKF